MIITGTFVWRGHFVWTAFVDGASCYFLYWGCVCCCSDQSGNTDHGVGADFPAACDAARARCCCRAEGASGDWKEAIREAS